MAATTRTFTRMVWLLPSRSNSCSCSARKSLGCNSSGRSPISSRNRRAPVGELEAPLGLRAGARESSSFVAEEFALQQGPGNRRAVQGDEWPLPSRTLVVNGAGDDFFARAGFALNQCHAVAIADHTNQVQDLLKREAASHNLDGAGGAWLAIHRNPPSLMRYLPRPSPVIHSRTYGSQFTSAMPAASHRVRKSMPS